MWGTDYIVDQGSSGFFLAQQKHATAIKTVLIDDTGITKPPEVYAWPLPKPQHWAELIPAVLVPPVLILGSTVYQTWQWASGSSSVPGTLTDITVMGGLVLVHLLSAWFWTRRACQRRQLHSNESRSWQWASCVFGIVVPVMVYCFHERVAADECSECGTLVRVDEIACPECDQAHVKTPPRGIVISASPNVPSSEEQLA